MLTKFECDASRGNTSNPKRLWANRCCESVTLKNCASDCCFNRSHFRDCWERLMISQIFCSIQAVLRSRGNQRGQFGGVEIPQDSRVAEVRQKIAASLAKTGKPIERQRKLRQNGQCSSLIPIAPMDEISRPGNETISRDIGSASLHTNPDRFGGGRKDPIDEGRSHQGGG